MHAIEGSVKRLDKLPRLRIAATAACLVACGLVIALWVRSYYWMDYGGVTLNKVGGIRLNSFCGSLYVLMQPRAGRSYCDLRHSSLLAPGVARPPFRLGGEFRLLESGVMFPHWFLALVVGVSATVPWIKWSYRYSLRTMLIVTTLVAVLMSFVVAFR